jgi:tRNA U34 5-carboxymethylaminomethyl modifying GTPase MnmE/TrmE
MFPRAAFVHRRDGVEFHGHGGPAVMRLLLARCVALGARIAEPGEVHQARVPQRTSSTSRRRKASPT